MCCLATTRMRSIKLRAKIINISSQLSHGAVMQVNHTIPEAAFVHQVKVQLDIMRKKLLAPSHQDRRDKKVILVNQPGSDRLSGKMGTTNTKVTS